MHSNPYARDFCIQLHSFEHQCFVLITQDDSPQCGRFHIQMMALNEKLTQQVFTR